MFDIKMIRENPEIVRKNIEKRNAPEKLKMLEKLIEVDKEKRALIQKTQQLKYERNVITKEISKLKSEGKDIEKKLKQAANIPNQIKSIDGQLEKLEELCKNLLMNIPNMLDDSVPIGKDEHDNVEVKKWGSRPNFDFSPKNHLEILENLELIDIERAAKVTGHGFFYLKNELAMLDNAIQNYAVDLLTKRGYSFIVPPYMMHRKAYEGVTDLAAFHDVLYKIDSEDLYMIATAEHPVGAMMINEVIEKKALPLKFVGRSPCFRKEVGAHGKYTKGLFRTHQFHKIEQFIFCLPEQSWKLHEELQKNCEDLYQGLGLHYRVVNVCTGDIGDIAAKKYDTEVWMADGEFREIGSNSNCTDYQARRLNVKYREKEGMPSAGFVHTLNNTALATSRTIVAIIEQYQQADGTIKIPDVLVHYMNGMKFIGKG